MIDCKECQSMIDAYLDGELTRDARAQFTDHISSCDICKKELAFAEGVKKTLSALPEIEVPSDFTEKLNARLKAEKKKSPIIRYTARYGALAACIVLAVVIGTGISKTDLSDRFDFTGRSGDITAVQDYAGETAPTNEKEDEQSLIVPRGGEPLPAGTPMPAKSRMAEDTAGDTEKVTAITEAYSLEKDTAEDIHPIVITASGVGGEFAEELALMVATPEDGVYTVTAEEFANFISALETVGVEYTQSGKAENDTVRFKLDIK